MAVRPIFVASPEPPFVQKKTVGFGFAPGFAVSQARKNIAHLHESYMKAWHKTEPLEISSKSMQELGVELSAFKLVYHLPDGRHYTVEQIFQASKVFTNGGPYTDLLDMKPKDAKKDPRLRSSGAVKGFRFDGVDYPSEPETAFYNWIWINALLTNPDLSERIMNYDAFTDIVFNPQKSLNCQAEAAAVYVGLKKTGKLEEAMAAFDAFVKTVCQPPTA